MAKCRYATKYWDYESHAEVPYNCDSENEEDILPSGLCVFHDKIYLQDKENPKVKEYEKKARDRLMAKVRNVKVDWEKKTAKVFADGSAWKPEFSIKKEKTG